jgi:hypothetical protein
MLKSPLRTALIAATILYVSCAKDESLSALPAADRVLVGQLKSEFIAGEIAEPSSVSRLLEFANSQRQRLWSSGQVVHTKCSLSFTFMSGPNHLGYIALDGNSFFSSGHSGQAQRPASPQEAQAFIALVSSALLPEPFKQGKCKLP